MVHKENLWRTIALILASFILYQHIWPLATQPYQNSAPIQIVSHVSAAEVYPEFTCPCCGRPLNKENPCCELMTEMIDFIDKQIAAKKTKEAVILATVKKFGIERLTNQTRQAEIKKILAEYAPPDAPKIIITPESHEFGKVSQKQGVIHTDFKITNQGKSDLIIKKISTSCGCTSASIIYQGREGPRFSMEGHGKQNPSDWQVNIAAGDKAILRVYYDPAYHPDLTGPITRTVSVFSNDPVEFEKRVKITLDQIP